MNTKDINNNLLIAEKYFRINKMDLAEAILLDILFLSPNNSKANELLAYINSRRSQPAIAHELLLKACESNMCSAEALYYLGKSHLNRNEYSNAINILKESIKRHGNFFEGLHDLGVAQAQLGLKDEALETFNMALSINNNSVSILFNIAKLLSELGNPNESIKYCDEVISLSPNFSEAWFHKGVLLSDAKHFEEALVCFENVILDNKDYYKAWLNKGIVLKYLNRLDLAEISYKKAFEISPNDLKVLNEYGLFFLEKSIHSVAINFFDKALSLNSNNVDALINKALTLNELKFYSESILLYRKAIAIDPLSAICWSNLGIVENNIGEHNNALSCFEKAIHLKPDYAEAWSNKGVMFMDTNNYEQAVLCFKTAISFESQNPNYHHNLSHAYFNLCNFGNAWVEYEWRWQLKNMLPDKLISNKPLWNGIKSDSRLFIWAEQGIGDQILFSSLFNELRAYAGDIIISADKKLLPIFRRSFPNFNFIDRKQSLSDEYYDYHIPIGSIAKYFRNTIDDFNSCIHPYLIVDQGITNKKIQKFKSSQHLICGISWRSFNMQIGDKKSIPLSELAPILNMQDINFLNLQNYPNHFNPLLEDNVALMQKTLINFENLDLHNDLDNLAFLIDNCDVIITCSNSTAHIAGALNKQTLLLAPFSSGKFWYWNEYESKSIWYPSIKVFYQSKDGSWENAINSIVKYLKST